MNKCAKIYLLLKRERALSRHQVQVGSSWVCKCTCVYVHVRVEVHSPLGCLPSSFTETGSLSCAQSLANRFAISAFHVLELLASCHLRPLWVLGM